MSEDTEKDLHVDANGTHDANQQTPSSDALSIEDADVELVVGGLHKVDPKSLFGKARR